MMVSGLLISDKFKIVTGSNTNHILYTELLDTHAGTVKLYNNTDMDQRKQIESSESLTNRSVEKPKAVLVFKNGDIHFKGYQVTLTPRRFRNFDNLLSELTRVTNLPRGARYIFTPMNGTRVNSLDQLNNGQKYVCDSLPKLKKVDYDKIAAKGSKTMVTKDFKLVNPGYLSQTHPVDGEDLPMNLRPKVITAVRNGVGKPHTKVKLLLNKKTAHTLMQVLDDVTSAIGSDGCIRKLYNLDGKRIQKLSELFNEDDVYIAVGGERFRPFDIPEIKNELGLVEPSDQFDTSRDKAESRDKSESSNIPPLSSKNTNSFKRKKVNIKPKYDNNNEEITDGDYHTLSIHGSHTEPQMRIDSKENDPMNEIADLPVIKQYNHDQIFYTKEGRAQLLQNIDYFKNKGNIYIHHQATSKVDTNVFHKKRIGRYKPLPSIHGSISHAKGRSGDEDDKPRRRRRKKRMSTSDSDSDCALDLEISPRKNEHFILPLFKNNGERENGLVVNGNDPEIRQLDNRDERDNEASVDDKNNKNKIDNHSMKYQNKHTIKDIFNDIFNINAHAYNQGKHFNDNDFTMDKDQEKVSKHQVENEKEEKEEEVQSIDNRDENDRQGTEVKKNEVDIAARTVEADDVEDNEDEGNKDKSKYVGKKLVVNLVVDDGTENEVEVNNSEVNREVNLVEKGIDAEVDEVNVVDVKADEVNVVVEANDIEKGVDDNADEDGVVRVKGEDEDGIEVNLVEKNNFQKDNIDIYPLEDNNNQNNDNAEVIVVKDSYVEVSEVKDMYADVNYVEVIQDNIDGDDAEVDIADNEHDVNNNIKVNSPHGLDTDIAIDNTVANIEDNLIKDIEVENYDIEVRDVELDGVDNSYVRDNNFEISRIGRSNIRRRNNDVKSKDAEKNSTRENVEDKDINVFNAEVNEVSTSVENEVNEVKQANIDTTDGNHRAIESQSDAKYITTSEDLDESGIHSDSEPIISSLTDLDTEEIQSDAQKLNKVDITKENEDVSLDHTDSDSNISSISDMSADESRIDVEIPDHLDEDVDNMTSEEVDYTASKGVIASQSAENIDFNISDTDAPDETDITMDNEGFHIEGKSVVDDTSHDESDVEEEEDIVTYLNNLAKQTEKTMSERMGVLEHMPDIEEHGTVIHEKDENVEESDRDEEEDTVVNKFIADSVDDIKCGGTVVISRDVDVVVVEEYNGNVPLAAINTIDEHILTDNSLIPMNNIHEDTINEDKLNDDSLATINEINEDIVIHDSLATTTEINEDKLNDDSLANTNKINEDILVDDSLSTSNNIPKDDSFTTENKIDEDKLTDDTLASTSTNNEDILNDDSLPTANAVNKDTLIGDSLTYVDGEKTYVINNSNNNNYNNNNNNDNNNNNNNNNNNIVDNTRAIDDIEYKENFNNEPRDDLDDVANEDVNKYITHSDNNSISIHDDKNINGSDKYNNDAIDHHNNLVNKNHIKANDNNISSEIRDLVDEQIPKDTSYSPDNHSENVTNQLFSDQGIGAFYDIGEMLGDGNFAVVHRVMDLRTHTAYAMKIIDATKIQGKEELLYNEIRIQAECNHPNLVKLYTDFHSPREIYLVMELVRGGDFFDYISDNEKLEEIEASIYVRDLCSGIDYLHRRGVVHRDIKPENLLLCTSSVGEVMVKIADFGLARRIKGPIYTVCGTPTYVAPEILTEGGYGVEVDIWAAGVILYIMLCGFPPFRSSKRQQSELFELIEAGEFDFLPPYWDDVSDLAKHLIVCMICVKKRERFTAAEVLDHDWLRRYGLSRTDTTLDEPLEKKTFRTLGKGSLAIEKFSQLARVERGEVDSPPPKIRRSRSGIT